MNRKGLFFTLGLGLFAFAILSLSIVASRHFGSYDDRFIEMIAFNRMSDLDMSLQDSIRELFIADSGITIGITSTQVTFDQKLPLDLADFNQSMKEFNDYVNSNDRNIYMDLSEARNSLPLRIKPNDILYSQNVSQRSITIMPTSMNIAGYSISVNLGNSQNITSCSKTSAEGAYNMTIEVIGSNGTSCTMTWLADISLNNNLTANGISVATIPGGGIKVTTPGTNTTVSSTVRLQSAGEDLPAAYLPDNIISIRLAALELYKNGTVKLA
ncbi:MAG: hypothetical protein V1906_02490 [Candidatus Woesearchaeota archaeon]